MKIVAIIRADNTIAPAYTSDIEIVQKIRGSKTEKMVLLEHRRSRNPKHHRLVHAMAKCTLDNMSGPWAQMYERDPSGAPHRFIKAVMHEIGIVEVLPNLDGTMRTETQSIAFENMDEDEFQPVSNAIAEVCAKTIGVTVDEFCRNYPRYL